MCEIMLLSAGKIEVVTTVSLWIIPKLLKGGIVKSQVGESKLPPARPVHDVSLNQVKIHLIGVFNPQTSNRGVPYDIFAAVGKSTVDECEPSACWLSDGTSRSGMGSLKLRNPLICGMVVVG